MTTLGSATAVVALLWVGGTASGAFASIQDDNPNSPVLAERTEALTYEGEFFLQGGIDHRRDEDWFRIPTEQIDYVAARAEGGEVLAEFVTVTSTEQVVTLGAGTPIISPSEAHYLRVRGRGGYLGSYRVLITAEAPTDPRRARVVTLEEPLSVEGRLDDPDDTDALLVTTEIESRVEIHLEERSNSQDTPTLIILDSSGKETARQQVAPGATVLSQRCAPGERLLIRIAPTPETRFWSYGLEVRSVEDDIGNTPDEARDLGSGADGAVDVTGIVESANDVDVFRYVPARSGQHELMVTAEDDDRDIVFRLLEADGTVVAIHDTTLDSESREFARVDCEAGRPVFFAVGQYGSSRTRYQLSVVPPEADDAPDYPADALELSPQVSGELLFLGKLEREGDVDVFRYRPQRAGLHRFQVEAEGLEPFDLQLQVHGIDTGPVLVDYSFDDVEHFALDCDVGGPVVFGVRACRGPGAGNLVGHYSIRIEADTQDDCGDLPPTAQDLLLDDFGNAELSGILESRGDRDVFRITPVLGGTHRVRLEHSGSPDDLGLVGILPSGEVKDHVIGGAAYRIEGVSGTPVLLAVYSPTGGILSYRIYVEGPAPRRARDDDEVREITPSGDFEQSVDVALSGPGDRDRFRYVPEREGRMLLILPEGQAYLRVYAFDGSPLPSVGTRSCIQLDVEAGVPVWFGAEGAAGSYQIRVLPPIPDDHGNFASVASPCTGERPRTATGVIDHPLDRDTFRFDAPTSGDYRFTVTSTDEAAPITFNQIDVGDRQVRRAEPGPTANSMRLVLTLTAGQSTFVRVRSRSRTNRDPQGYVLRVEPDAD